MKRKLFLTFGVLVVLGAAVFFTLPRLVDQRMNGIAHAAPYTASARATALHNTLFVADLMGGNVLRLLQTQLPAK